MKPKQPGIQIVRKVEEEKPTKPQAFMVGFLLSSLLICPILIAAGILTKIYTKFNAQEFYGVYISIGFGLLLSFILAFIFMWLATK